MTCRAYNIISRLILNSCYFLLKVILKTEILRLRLFFLQVYYAAEAKQNYKRGSKILYTPSLCLLHSFVLSPSQGLNCS